MSGPRGHGLVAGVKRKLRRWIEAGYEIAGECNLCGDCCHTIWMCEGHRTIADPLDLPCEECGEGFHTQVERVTCPYLSEEDTCSLYTPESGLPFNCCRNFPQVKDILWHPGFYEELPDCDFHLVRKRLPVLNRLLHLAVLPLLGYFRIRRRNVFDGRLPVSASKGSNAVAAPDPRHPVKEPVSFEV